MRAPDPAAAAGRQSAPRSTPAGRFRYRVAGLVLDTNCRVPLAARILTEAAPDAVLDVNRPWSEAPRAVRELPVPSSQTSFSWGPDGWAVIDHRRTWLAVGRDGRAAAGVPPRFDPAAIGAPSLAEYWMALLVTGLGAHLVRACDRGRHVTLHTAGVALGRAGPGILLTGASGAGKSTVATGLQRLGCYWATGDTTRVERCAAAPGGWKLTPWWPVKLGFFRPGTRWPTFHPAGPRYLRDPVPLGAVYTLLTRRRSAAVRIERASASLGVRLRRAARLFMPLHGPDPDRRGERWDAAEEWGGSGPPVYTVERPLECPPDETAAVVAEHAQRILGAAESVVREPRPERASGTGDGQS